MSSAREDANFVRTSYKPGTRLRCTRNGKTYQMGTRVGMSFFWMFCEEDREKGKVNASEILRSFERIAEEKVSA